MKTVIKKSVLTIQRFRLAYNSDSPLDMFQHQYGTIWAGALLGGLTFVLTAAFFYHI